MGLRADTVWRYNWLSLPSCIPGEQNTHCASSINSINPKHYYQLNLVFGQDTEALRSTTVHRVVYMHAYNLATTNLTLPDMGVLKTVLAQAIVQKCFLNLLSCGHHEGAILHDFLVERLSRDQNKIGVAL